VNPAFSGWKTGLPFYGPVLVAGVLATGLLAWLGLWWAGVPILALGIGMLLFFRDFPRAITAAANEAVAPADGKVVGVETLASTPYYDGPCQRLSIFLSVLDVHVNRSPCEATVRDVQYKTGLFKVAMRADTSDINESNTIYLDTPHGPVTVRQISGAIARRIVCPVKPGAQLATGERFGMIRFGSRTELYLPPTAKFIAANGDRVRGGATVVARFS
jgi:phosphatidylserine decarboxylase